MSAVIQGPAAAGTLTGLARALVQQGKLRPDRAENFARKALQSNTQFIDELIGSTEVTGLNPAAVAKFAADTFGHPLLDLAAVDHEQLPRDIIDRKLVGSLRVVALRKRGNRLAVAMSDPTNLQALDQIKFQTQLALDIVVVEHDKLMRLVDANAQTTAQALESMVGGDDVSFDELLGESPEAARPKTHRRSTTRRSSASCRSCCSTRSAKAHPTCTSSRTRSSTGSASGSTASCARSRSRRWRSRSVCRRASRSSRGSTSRRSACRRTGG